MPNNIIEVRIKERCDTEANWASADPVLLKGECVYSSDKGNQYKQGDGTSHWSELSYAQASPLSHTHTKSQITDFPSSLKNPKALTLQGNGTTLTNGTYDGSAAKTVNITPAAIGAAASSHGTHVSFSTTAPVMDGTASVGTATTVARSDHKHPTDTSRAAKDHTHTSLNPVLLTNEDLDTLKPDVITFYYAAGSNSVTHNPFGSGTAFGMFVYRSAQGYKVQNATSLTGVVKKRFFNSSTWSAWNIIPEFTVNPATNQVLISSNTEGGIKSSGYTIAKSVPSNAVFTDTHHTSKNVIGSATAVSNTTVALTNGNVYLNNVENGQVRSSHKISGSGATTVTSDASGNIIINSTNTTYSAAGASLGLVKSGGDVTISNGVITVNDNSHNHSISNITGLQAGLDSKALASRTINGKALTNDITLNASDVGADALGSSYSALTEAKGYCDTKIADLIGQAPETLNALDELATALGNDPNFATTISTQIGTKADVSDVNEHTTNTSNPHKVTKAQVGLGNVPNVTTNNQTPTYSKATSLSDLVSGEVLSTAMGKISQAVTSLITHIANVSNPHKVTKAQVGLGNVENKSAATILSEMTNANVATALGYTPARANNAVEQVDGGNDDIDYRVLLSSTATDTTVVDKVKKDADFCYNPSTGTLTVTAIKIGNATLKYDTTENAIVVIPG